MLSLWSTSWGGVNNGQPVGGDVTTVRQAIAAPSSFMQTVGCFVSIHRLGYWMASLASHLRGMNDGQLAGG